MGQQEDVSSQGKASVRYYIRTVDDDKLTWVIKVSVYDLVNNYNHVEDTKVSVSIKRTNAKQCTLSEIFF